MSLFVYLASLILIIKSRNYFINVLLVHTDTLFVILKRTIDILAPIGIILKGLDKGVENDFENHFLRSITVHSCIRVRNHCHMHGFQIT